MINGFLRLVLFVALGLVVSFAVSVWHYMPADQSGAPLLDRAKAFSNRTLADLPNLPSLQTELDLWKQAALSPTAVPQDNSDPATKNLILMTNVMKTEFTTMLEFRKRIDFWHDVALGTACLALGGLIGGLFRRRAREHSGYE